MNTEQNHGDGAGIRPDRPVDPASRTPILTVERLKKYYPVKGGVITHKIGDVRAVDGVSFTVYQGETLGLVGESGCGKSTLGRQIVALERPTAGKILYRGVDLASMNRREMAGIRTELQMVFQDSYSALNPRKHIYELLSEPMLMVCDEPVSALDVSIQAQILNLLRDLQKELDLTCIFIGHGLGAVNYVSDRIAVMYLGKIVELADARELFADPIHPYSKALFRAVPIPDPRARETEIPVLQGEIASNTRCRFHPRCPYARQECSEIEPELKPAFAGSGHLVACPVLAGEENEKGGGPTYG